MNVAGLEIVGESISGIGTCITLPTMGINLDMGVVTDEALKVQNVLLTHGHLDHAHGITRHVYLRSLVHTGSTRIICPKGLVDLVHQLFHLWAKFQQSKLPDYEVVGVAPGEEVTAGIYKVRPFKTNHRIPSQGYAVIETRHKLMPEFMGMAGPEIGRLRKNGVQITTPQEVIQVAFTGDTRADLFDQDLPLIRDAKVLITECTFVGDDQDGTFANKRGHLHLDDLSARADKFAGNEALVLSHFSQRYPRNFLRQEIAKMPEGLREKTHILFGGHGEKM